MLKLSVQCTRFESNYSIVQVGALKINVGAVQALWKKETLEKGNTGKRKHRMKLSLPPKLVEILVWVPVVSFYKIFTPSYVFDALLCRNKLAILAP
jgi:hypothetical protein